MGYSRPKKKDLFYISPNDIEAEEGFNPREDYGDMKLLENQIRENGVLVPLRGFKKKGGKYIITDGHRRLKASKEIIKEYPDMLIPFIIDKNASNPEQRILSVLLFNDGEPLNPLEEAEAINRLINFGLNEKEISKKTGKSGVYISNLKLLYNAPTKIKNLIKKDTISSTLAMQVLRDTKDYHKAVEIIENAVVFAANKGKEKVVSRDLNQSQGKVNSFVEMKKCFKLGIKNERKIKEENKYLYDFANKIISGEFTQEELDALFYEPIK